MRGRARKSFRGTVLIADDHQLVRAGLVQLLRRCLGARKIVEAVCFEDVIAHLASPQIALAIVDLGMPGLTGAADLKRMREARPNARMVVLSGSASQADILDALKAGMHGYIIKSQTSDELIAKLRYVLSGEIYVPSRLADLALDAAPAAAAHPDQQPSPTPGQRKALSRRQLQVLEGIVEGKSNKRIAQELNIAEGTVKMHLASLFRVLGASNRAHAAAQGKQYLA
jgi:DNA-binding NarL/FixJ family response regulator